jgi:hypothetical protein
MPMPRTMVVVAMAATLTLGVGLPAANATTSTPSTSSSGCASSSLAKSKASLLTTLSKESTTLLGQKVLYGPELLADQLELASPSLPTGSHQALVLAGKIVVLQARLDAVTTSLTSVATDVSGLAVCTSKEFSAVKKHVSWRKLISQRALVTAELSVARSDLAFQRAALAREKKSSDPSKIKAAAEKAIDKLITMDDSQIKTDKAELKGITKKLKAL